MLLPLVAVVTYNIKCGVRVPWSSVGISEKAASYQASWAKLEWLYGGNGSVVERAAFSRGLERVLVGYSTVELLAFKSMAYRPRLLVPSSASHVFWGYILTINVYLLYSIWQRLKSLLAVMCFHMVVCYVEQSVLLRRSPEFSSLIDFYSFLLGNMKYVKMCTCSQHSCPQIYIFFVISYFENMRGNLQLF